MTDNERWELYEDGTFRQTIGIKLLDWAGYQTIIDHSQESALVQAQKKRAIDMILQDLGYIVKIVSGLVISDPGIKQATPPVTDELVKSIVDAVMQNQLAWITGIDSVPEPDEE